MKQLRIKLSKKQFHIPRVLCSHTHIHLARASLALALLTLSSAHELDSAVVSNQSPALFTHTHSHTHTDTACSNLESWLTAVL